MCSTNTGRHPVAPDPSVPPVLANPLASPAGQVAVDGMGKRLGADKRPPVPRQHACRADSCSHGGDPGPRQGP